MDLDGSGALDRAEMFELCDAMRVWDTITEAEVDGILDKCVAPHRVCNYCLSGCRRGNIVDAPVVSWMQVC